ncbi:MAG: Gfo/Idh/MocA family oxidoreductase [Bacteroidales bacterium]|nr:Gfo/Idh/MocA family oxidoreductase [Bacteroidales bacterium]
MFVALNYLFMIKTGILGTSETANFYATILKNSDSFELTGCFSPDYDKAKTFAANFGQIAYPTAEALFKYADVLIITDFSPDFLNITTKALKNFKHVLVTNPFLAGLDEIQYLRKLSEESRVIFQIAGGFNYNPYISGFINKTGYLAELKHSCNCEPGLCNNTVIWRYFCKTQLFSFHLCVERPKEFPLILGIARG